MTVGGIPCPLTFIKMIDVTLVCVGRLKEKFYKDACDEYIKRLGAYCRLTVTEIAEERRGDSPSQAQTDAALLREDEAIKRAVPKGAAVIALCVEGREMSSPELAGAIGELTGSFQKLCFIIGGSDGLSDGVKSMARLRLSMSPMTFPHHLARVMVLEQLYRAFSILNGGRYHK